MPLNVNPCSIIELKILNHLTTLKSLKSIKDLGTYIIWCHPFILCPNKQNNKYTKYFHQQLSIEAGNLLFKNSGPKLFASKTQKL